MNLLLAINTAAGTGHESGLGSEMARLLQSYLGAQYSVHLSFADGHGDVSKRARSFINETGPNAVIIAGGGGGTLRAVIEGVSAKDGALPNPHQLRVGALRMGSGNVIARQLGVARDPREGVEELAAQLLAKKTAKCCVIGCETSDHPSSLYGATLGGFGLFGHVPKCLELHHEKRPGFHRFSAGMLGIERLTNVEYGACLMGLCLRTALNPNRIDMVEVQQGERVERFRLLAGALMNFPLKPIPFQPGVNLEDDELSLHLVPFHSSWQALTMMLRQKRVAHGARRFRITADAPLTLRAAKNKKLNFFLDEDPLTARELTLRVAGRLAFVPGKNFKPSKTK